MKYVIIEKVTDGCFLYFIAAQTAGRHCLLKHCEVSCALCDDLCFFTVAQSTVHTHFPDSVVRQQSKYEIEK